MEADQLNKVSNVCFFQIAEVVPFKRTASMRCIIEGGAIKKTLLVGLPTPRLRNSSCCLCHKKYGTLLVLLYFSNIVKWVASKLLTVILTTWFQYLSILILTDGWGAWPHVLHLSSDRRVRRTKSKDPKGTQLKARPLDF